MAEAVTLVQAGDELPDPLQVRLFEARVIWIGDEWRTRDVRSSFWRLYANNRDGASLELPERRYALRAGMVHLVPAWVQFSCHNEALVRHFYVHFDLVGLPGALARQLFGQPVGIAAPAVLAMVEELLAPPADPDAALLRVKALVDLALAELLVLTPLPAGWRQRGLRLGSSAIGPALRYIEEHLDQPLTNQRLAATCAVSTDHFIRRFRELVGQSPAQYVLERRVTKAAQWLAFGSDSIDRIAARAGFANRHYFSRVFAQRMGVPPAAYRRTSRV